MFVENYRDTVYYNVENKIWMIWNGEYWQPDKFNQIKIFAEIVIEQMRNEAINQQPGKRVKRCLLTLIVYLILMVRRPCLKEGTTC